MRDGEEFVVVVVVFESADRRKTNCQ
jgi:hypothetical protein